MKRVSRLSCSLVLLTLVIGCQPAPQGRRYSPAPRSSVIRLPFAPNAAPQLKATVESAIEQTKITTGYDPSYVSIDYPGGDVALDTGVCSDVIVRAFRRAGIDLQKEVHEDMMRAWNVYPRKWGAGGPDTNIDHRRVLNLTTYFDRQGKSVPVTYNRDDYLPGDIVSWDLGNGVDHVGLVVNMLSEVSHGYLLVHNIGAGAKMEDVLMQWRITGHYRYF